MRLYATPESVEREEISLLAIAETILAMSISVGIALYYGTVTHILISAAIAPFLLLRSKESTEIGLDIAESSINSIIKLYDMMKKLVGHGESDVLNLIISLIIIPIICPLCLCYAKTTAICISFASNPSLCIRMIPKNLKKYSCAVDLFIAPELVPDQHRSVIFSKFGIVSIYDFIYVSIIKKHDRTKEGEAIGTVILVIFACAIFLPLIIPAILYRISLKSTALLWCPLILVLSPLANDPRSFKLAFTDVVQLETQRIRRWFSAAVFALFCAKLAVLWCWLEVSELWSRIPHVEIVNRYIVPQGLPWWQVASAVNALITFYVYFYIKDQARRIEAGAETPPLAVVRTIDGWTVVQRILSFYTIFCTFVITASLVPEVARLFSNQVWPEQIHELWRLLAP